MSCIIVYIRVGKSDQISDYDRLHATIFLYVTGGGGYNTLTLSASKGLSYHSLKFGPIFQPWL